MTYNYNSDENKSNGNDPSNYLDEWAASTTQAWSSEVLKEWKRKERRERMARFRAFKKSELARLRDERGRLDKKVQQLMVPWINAAASRRMKDSPTLSGSNGLIDEVCRLAVESDFLRSYNLQLYQKFQEHNRFWSLVLEASVSVGISSECEPSSRTIRQESRISDSVACWNLQKLPGWRVRFPNGEPSFDFNPFTRAEIDSVVERCEEFLVINPISTKEARTVFGWTMHCAPLVQGLNGDDLIAHTRLTTCGQFSLEDADAILSGTSVTSLPPLVVPLNTGNKLECACTQVLQEFDQDTHVLVSNIPGPTHIRYIFLARRLLRIEENGRRSLTFILTVANSHTNSQSRVEEQHQDVQWVDEGGNYVQFTEMDQGMVKVRLDQWARCDSQLHAEHLYIQWAQFAYQAAQGLLSAKLLKSE